MDKNIFSFQNKGVSRILLSFIFLVSILLIISLSHQAQAYPRYIEHDITALALHLNNLSSDTPLSDTFTNKQFIFVNATFNTTDGGFATSHPIIGSNNVTIQISLYNGSEPANFSMSNSSLVEWTYNISDTNGFSLSHKQNITWEIFILDNESNILQFGSFNNTIDTLSPTNFTVVDPTPANNSFVSNSSIIINITFEDDFAITDNSTCILQVGHSNNKTLTNVSMTKTFMSTSSGGRWNCVRNETVLFTNQFDSNWTIFINDSADNWFISEVFNVTRDADKPTYVEPFNFTVNNDSTDTYLNFSVNFNEKYPDTLWFRVFKQNGGIEDVTILQSDNFTVSDGASTGNTSHNFRFAFSDTSGLDDGYVKFNFRLNDSAGNENFSDFNITALHSRTGNNGWQLITLTAAGNISMSRICAKLPKCTNVAFFNNTGDIGSGGSGNYTGKGYITFAQTAPTVNNNIETSQGNHTWVFTSSANSWWSLDQLWNVTQGATNASGFNNQNISYQSVNQSVWSIMVFLKTNNITAPFYVQNDSTPGGTNGLGNFSIRHVAIWNASLQGFNTCIYNFTKCTGTFNTAENITVTPITPVWFTSEANITINHTSFPFDTTRIVKGMSP